MIRERTIRRRAAAFLYLILNIVLWSPLAGAQSYIYNREDFVTGIGPAGAVVADLNHDGRLDLAVTNTADNTVSILLNTGGGVFAPKVDYATGASPAFLATADFQGDGKADLAVLNNYDGTGNPGTVSILLGNGDGTFQSHVDYSVGNYPVGIVAADLNGDGKIDLAIANDSDSTVSILLGNGDGTFQSQLLVSVGAEPTSLGSGDFNGDGKLDLITSNVGSGTVTVLLSKGKGGFTRVDSPTGISSPDFSALAVGDFDRDGKLDVVVSSIGGPLLLLRGKGDGSFQSPSSISGSQPDAIRCVLAADFNHDGKVDLVEEGSIGLIIVLPGNGDGTFQPPAFSSQGGAVTATALASADVNGDGAVDLLATDGNLDAIDVLLGNGDGTFTNMKNVLLAQTPYGPTSAVAADFNGDGMLDLAVAESDYPNPQLAVELGKGNGTFGKPIVSVFGSSASNASRMFAGDFSGDGKADVAIVDDNGTGFQVLLGKGDGTFQAAVDTSLSNVGGLVVGDFNRDGKTDLAVNTSSGFTVSLGIYLSNGDGTFRLATQYTLNESVAVAADVNHDGILDLVGAGEQVQVLLGKGDGTFGSPILGPRDSYSQAPIVGDFNGDGKPDVAVGTYEGMAFLAGNGDGTFQKAIYSNSAYQFFGRMATGDFDGDGQLDLVTYPPGDSTLDGTVVMVGNGDGTFQLPVAYGQTGPWPVDLIAGDFNSDHVDDVGMPNQNNTGESVVSLYLSAPTVTLFPTALHFGFEPLGKTSPSQDIELTNAGNSPLTISSITAAGDFIEQTNCGTSLGIGKSCTIQVAYQPTGARASTGTVIIVDNATPNPQVIPLHANIVAQRNPQSAAAFHRR